MRVAKVSCLREQAHVKEGVTEATPGEQEWLGVKSCQGVRPGGFPRSAARWQSAVQQAASVPGSEGRARGLASMRQPESAEGSVNRDGTPSICIDISKVIITLRATLLSTSAALRRIQAVRTTCAMREECSGRARRRWGDEFLSYCTAAGCFSPTLASRS